MSSLTHLPINPFIYGKEISDPDRFIGRHHEIKQIRDRLHNKESTSIVGERRTGKSSLLCMLQNATMIERLGLDRDQYVPIYVDLGMIGKDMTPTRLWRLFLQKITPHVTDREAAAAIDNLRGQETIEYIALNTLFQEYLNRQGCLFALLLDEFEEITCNAAFDKNFFSGFRSLAIHHNLVLVTASRAPLIDLTHSEAIRSSPFFNIFATIYLPLFTLAESRELIDKATQPTNLRFRPDETAYLIQISGRHPFLLQIASSCLFRAYSQGMSKEKRRAYLFTQFNQESDLHFSYLWQHSDDTQKIGLTALALLANPKSEEAVTAEKHSLHRYFDDAKGVMKKLQRRGVVIIENEEYQIFSPAFANWIIGEIKASMIEPQEYKAWLQQYETHGDFSRLPSRALDEVKTQVLPKVAASYRQLIVNWLSDPKTIVNVVGLLRSVLS